MGDRPILTMLALVALALGTLVLLRQSEEDEPGTAATPDLGVGYYVTDARLAGTDDYGRVQYRITAARVVQQPADGSVSMQDVAVDYDPAVDVPWKLTADTGRMRPGDKMIELSGHVVAATREADSPAAIVRTDYLELDPGTETAATDREVVIDYAGSSVNAVGLRAYLREDRLQLLAAVTGRYVR